NLLRVVEVWMDEYKKYFYKRRPHLKGQDFGDISAQLALKKKLNCKSFKWFLEEVGPDILKYYPPEEPEPAAWGAIKNVAKDVCLDGSHGNEGMRLKAKMCLATNERESSDQDKGQLYHPISGKCLEFSSKSNSEDVYMANCNEQELNQHWQFAHFNSSRLDEINKNSR
ncbi:polypeptide N-acetylgalactosaminyltransferase 10-like, partial [Saccoglossus kowalevskii]|uniref:Polypeptide N-acetylgalactosaminyltransferase-like 6-like n=1 Tax=Saccoglossus kowalevskii TaxID=10224 RepID=A0ABM0M5G3_SACKO